MISVIVPVYNVEKYLRQCLDSVICQTYSDLEILIVDDGSTDESGSICDEYKTDKRVSVFHTDNRGISAARNYAIDRSHGDYIAFLDSDDWLEATALEQFINIAHNTGADIVACQFYSEYSNRTIEPKGLENGFTVKDENILNTMIIDHKLTDDAWNKLYKASLFNTIRYPEGRIFEDISTTYKILHRASLLVYTPSCFIHYRNRANSLSNIHSMKSLVDYWIAYRERFDIIGCISERYYRVALSECINAISRMWRWYSGCSKAEKEEAQKYIKDMQQFVKAHKNEVLRGAYSKHVKSTCYYAKYKSPIIFKSLYLMNKIYRSRNKNKLFDQ